MTYERGFPNVSQTEPPRPAPAAALTFAGWPKYEAERRVSTLLRCGWTAKQLAAMFGVAVAEIDRLTGQSDQPVDVAAREVA